jgi:Fusaric acid resistance protein-like
LDGLRQFVEIVLVAVGALLPIVNPLGGAPIYLAATAGLTPEQQRAMAKAVAVHALTIGANPERGVRTHVLTALGHLLGVVIVALPVYLCYRFADRILGLLRALTRSDLTGYRMGAVTAAIVLLVPRTGPPWEIAWHRFVEVSIGIGVALLFAKVWPEREVPLSGKS